MKDFLTALDMCLHTFISIPLPQGRWDERLRRQSTAYLPLVGLLIGGIWLLIAYLARLLLPLMLSSALIAALPFILTGFIHLDGFMDTSDAILSWRKREERLRILKDVHIGAFSVVMLALLMLFQFAACAELTSLAPLLLIPVLSRAGSAFCVLRLKPLEHSEYKHVDAQKSLANAVIVMAALAMLLLTIISGWRGSIVGAACLLGYALAMWRCVRSLGGVSGDLAGFSLTVSELCGLIALAIV